MKVLRFWKERIDSLQNPKDRPNDFQRLVLSVIERGMSVRDASRVFGQTEQTLFNWRKKYGRVKTADDMTYFIVRAHQLGASDEAIAGWFGLQRADQVAMITAKAKDSA